MAPRVPKAGGASAGGYVAPIEVTAKELDAPIKYCAVADRKGQKIIACPTGVNAGRFGATAQKLMTNGRQDSLIDGLPVIILPQGYSGAATSDTMLVLKLKPPYSNEFGPFVAVKKADYTANQAKYSKIGVPVQIADPENEAKIDTSNSYRRMEESARLKIANAFDRKGYTAYIESFNITKEDNNKFVIDIRFKHGAPPDKRREAEELAQAIGQPALKGNVPGNANIVAIRVTIL